MSELKKEFDVLVAGHICLDIIPQFDPHCRYTAASFSPGKLINVGAPLISSGGPVANTGLSLYRLGAAVDLRGLLGTDSFGQNLLQILKKENPILAAGMLEDANVTTSYSLVLSPPGLDRTFFHCPGANDSFEARHIDYSRVRNAKIFHFGYPSVMQKMYQNDGNGLVEVMRKAKEAGAVTSLDTTFPDQESPGGKANWQKIFKSTLPWVDVFLPSIEEILIMLFPEKYRTFGGKILEKITMDDLHYVASRLIEMGVKIVVLKLGNRGVYLETAGPEKMREMSALLTDTGLWSNCRIHQRCYEAKVIGTTGAGDAAIAGFLYGLAKGVSPKKAVQMASAVGACNVEAPDAISGIRSWGEIKKRIQNGWKEA